jgi:hypothetical protein
VGEDLLPEKSAEQCYQETLRLKAWAPSWLEQILSGREIWEDV